VQVCARDSRDAEAQPCEQVCDSIKADIAVAAQNCNFKGNGAFTGECSCDQIADIGCKWVVLGHSERRQYFKEDNEILKTKLEYALSKGLKVIYCIGESLEERQAGKTIDVCKSQLEPVKELLKADTVVIAYEPIWAIGTGVTATPEQAQETHKQVSARAYEPAPAPMRCGEGPVPRLADAQIRAPRRSVSTSRP
jgi:triosephosphate isomerase